MILEISKESGLYIILLLKIHTLLLRYYISTRYPSKNTKKLFKPSSGVAFNIYFRNEQHFWWWYELSSKFKYGFYLAAEVQYHVWAMKTIVENCRLNPNKYVPKMFEDFDWPNCKCQKVYLIIFGFFFTQIPSPRNIHSMVEV